MQQWHIRITVARHMTLCRVRRGTCDVACVSAHVRRVITFARGASRMYVARVQVGTVRRSATWSGTCGATRCALNTRMGYGNAPHVRSWLRYTS